MGRRLALVFAGSVGMVAVIGDAHAEIPYADQITPGELRGVAWDPGDEWVYGYWEYLPTTFDALGPDDRLPLLVFLPGIGEYDEDPACPGNADVCSADDCLRPRCRRPVGSRRRDRDTGDGTGRRLE